MPQSRKRKPHHHQAAPDAIHETRVKKGSAVLVVVIFFALIGISIAYFTAGPDPLWLIIGIIGGAVAGYFFGKQLDKSFSKK